MTPLAHPQGHWLSQLRPIRVTWLFWTFWKYYIYLCYPSCFIFTIYFLVSQGIPRAIAETKSLKVRSSAKRGPLPTEYALFASAWDRIQDLLFKGFKPLPLGPTHVGYIYYIDPSHKCKLSIMNMNMIFICFHVIYMCVSWMLFDFLILSKINV